jgi:pimeloyl-ACP methyl ester carboxylesterase
VKRQALADVAYLIDYTNKQTSGCTWFTFGGSYSGALSAWFRIKYPDHTRGSLSSSGVVNAVLQFTAFDEQVAEAIGDTCADSLRAVTATFERALANGQGPVVKQLFGARQDLSDGDFAYMMADGAAMVDQYNHKADLCAALAKPGPGADDMTVMKNFADFINAFWGADFGGSCFYDTQCVASDPSRWQPTSRSWWWQTCYELAYFQNAPSVGSLRMPLINMTYHLNRCAEQFYQGIYPDTVGTNDYYGGAFPNGTNIFFSDFSDDPWQRASVNETLSAGLPYEMVTCDGCGHCFDFHKPDPSDPPALTQERASFEKYLALWLQ